MPITNRNAAPTWPLDKERYSEAQHTGAALAAQLDEAEARVNAGIDSVPPYDEANFARILKSCGQIVQSEVVDEDKEK